MIYPTDQTLRPGTTLCHGIYRIERSIGRGGFGITYLAVNQNLNSLVCIKEFFPKGMYNRCDNGTTAVPSTTEPNELVLADSLKTKFLKEAQRIVSLNHPTIVRVSNAFAENGTAYYVMDYVKGSSLQEIVEHEGPMSVERAVHYIDAVGDALEYIHSLRINHLDVKPANILVENKTDRAVLIDFGLSKHYNAAGDQSSITPVGVSNGYAPIEQYDPDGVAYFSAATDVYSLAATLYFLLTGQRPPTATRLHDEIFVFPSEIPDYLRTAIERGMALTRNERYQSVADFLKAIHGKKVTPSTSVIPDVNDHLSSKRDVVRSVRRHSWRWIVPVSILLIGCGLTVWYFMSKPVDDVKEQQNKEVIDLYALKGFHTHPENLDILIEYNGVQGYFSEETWNQLSSAHRQYIHPIGIYIDNNDVEPFILNFGDDSQAMTWNEAIAAYGNAILSYNQARAIQGESGDIDRIRRSVGYVISGSYYWLGDGYVDNNDEAWCIDWESNAIGTSSKLSRLRVSTTSPVPVINGDKSVKTPETNVEKAIEAYDLAFGEVTGPVKSIIWNTYTVDEDGKVGDDFYQKTFSFDPQGRLTGYHFLDFFNFDVEYAADGTIKRIKNNASDYTPIEIVRNSDGQIISMINKADGELNRRDTWTWTSGRLTNIYSVCWEWIENYEYTYGKDGRLEMMVENYDYGEMDDPVKIYNNYTYTSIDSYGNWTRRTNARQGAPGADNLVEVRTIEYYQ